MIKVAHISTGLETGGAEVQLLRLLSSFDKNKYKIIVIGLDRDTYLGDRMRESGLPVHALNVKKNPLAIFKGYKLLKEFQPDVIHGTMYEGGVVGSVFRNFLPKKPRVIWTSHEPLEHYDNESLRKRLQLRLWGFMSKIPECMMYVSNLNMKQHLDWGFNNDKAIVSKQHNHVHYVLVGTNVDDSNKELTQLINNLGLKGKVHMLGNREDIPDIVNAFDLATLTSHGEAFPLTLGEAMVSEIPCVATDVGDNDYIIDKTGLVVPPQRRTSNERCMANNG